MFQIPNIECLLKNCLWLSIKLRSIPGLFEPKLPGSMSLDLHLMVCDICPSPTPQPPPPFSLWPIYWDSRRVITSPMPVLYSDTTGCGAMAPVAPRRPVTILRDHIILILTTAADTVLKIKSTNRLFKNNIHRFTRAESNVLQAPNMFNIWLSENQRLW